MGERITIELVEASGPVSPAFRYDTSITLTRNADGSARVVRRHRDRSGAHEEELELASAPFDALVAELHEALPASLDLVGDKRDRKGISFNHVMVVEDGRTTRLDYLLSHVDDDDGDERARRVVSIVKRAADFA